MLVELVKSMSRVNTVSKDNGFYGIGIVNNSDEKNIGVLWRSAYILGASFIFTVGKKYKPQGSDTTKTWAKIPLYHYKEIEDLKQNLPYSTKIIAVELSDNAESIYSFKHPDQAIYLLGNEQIGLSEAIIKLCHATVKIPGDRSLNVAVAGSIVMYDRQLKKVAE